MEILDAMAAGGAQPPFDVTVNDVPQAPGAGVEPGNDLTVASGDEVGLVPDAVDSPFLLLEVIFTVTGADSVTVRLVDENGNDLPESPAAPVSTMRQKHI